jgi:hypothetical protein
MKRQAVLLAVLLTVCTAAAPARQAEPPTAKAAPHFYNVDTERRVDGTIRKILFESRYESAPPFLVIILEERTTGRVYNVEVSPAGFFSQDFHQGERVRITGSFYSRDSELFLIAREIRAGGEIFRVRDRKGFPNWRGGGMKGKRRGRGM